MVDYVRTGSILSIFPGDLVRITVPEEETGFCEWFDTAYGQVKPCGYQYSTNINYDPIAKEVSKFFESYEYY
ncbi:hypothetical protein QCA50_008436 [Cerrena zonata]|uniref:Uncharacterized protein n=1 Tax=Cerrena zonata TaxID=2478898 RepID=A0AAW0GEN6_9APHY